MPEAFRDACDAVRATRVSSSSSSIRNSHLALFCIPSARAFSRTPGRPAAHSALPRALRPLLFLHLHLHGRPHPIPRPKPPQSAPLKTSLPTSLPSRRFQTGFRASRRTRVHLGSQSILLRKTRGFSRKYVKNEPYFISIFHPGETTFFRTFFNVKLGAANHVFADGYAARC